MAQALLEAGVANKLFASPVAVGAYVRRALAGADAERRRRIDAALQEMGALPSLGAPVVTVSPAAPMAGKKLSRTMTVPGPGATSRLSPRLRFGGTQLLYVALGLSLAFVAVAVIRTISHQRPRPAAAAVGSQP